MLRTADGLGVTQVYFTGYTPYPSQPNDERLPHLKVKIDKQISKTALGAEKTVNWKHVEDISEAIKDLKKEEYLIAALEQTPGSQSLNSYKSSKNIALVVGNEVDGLDAETINMTDIALEIPMSGSKESFNVAVAAAIALYALKFNA
jgi:tRNA G18 (ribose-2'-O)-methylase SpoU